MIFYLPQIFWDADRRGGRGIFSIIYHDESDTEIADRERARDNRTPLTPTRSHKGRGRFFNPQTRSAEIYFNVRESRMPDSEEKRING
jgi:hypothetical protein